MRKRLTIGKAAARLSIEVDTLRRLEREGVIRGERTQGGHRRFDEAEVARVAKLRSGRNNSHAAKPPRPVTGTRPRQLDVGSLARTVKPRGGEPAAIIQRDPENAAPLFTIGDEVGYRSPLRVETPSPSDAPRLESLKTYGIACIPFDIPAAWRARVIADLELFVSRTQFPSHISSLEATSLVSGRVEEVLGPYRDQQAREKASKGAEEHARWRLVALKIHGTSYAVRETADWDWSAQSEARREVTGELESKVKAEWSEREVEKLVDEVLEDWEGEDEDDDDEDPDWDDED